MLRAGLAGNSQQALNEYFRHIFGRGNSTWQCQQPPTVSSLKLSWKRRPVVASFSPPPKEEQERRGEYSFMLFPGLNISNFLCDSYHTWLMHPEACVTDLFIISDYSCLKIIQHASTAPDSFCLGIEINFPWLPSVHPTQSFRSFAARLLSCPSCGSL